MKVIAINGSVAGSKTGLALNNLKFADTVDLELLNLKDMTMSFADGRDYREYDNDNKLIVEKLIEADGIVIALPIYQASIPGVLKNILDLIPINALQSKPIGLIITAGSPRHYLVAQQHLIPVLDYLKMDVITKYVFIEASDLADRKLNDEIAMRIENLANELTYKIEAKLEKDKAMYDFL